MSVNTDSMIRNILDRVSRIGYVKPEDIPNIDLYMDQVTTFMEAQLAHSKRYEDDKILTKTMINNYAKNNLLPSPEKKRYSKEHLLVLIFIYYFKNILSISDIQTLLGPLTDKYFKSMDDMDLTAIYNEVFSMEKGQIESLQKELLERYEIAQGTFENAPEEDRDFLKLFSFICLLSFDVYVKKMLIEQMIDELRASTDTDTKHKKNNTASEVLILYYVKLPASLQVIFIYIAALSKSGRIYIPVSTSTGILDLNGIAGIQLSDLICIIIRFCITKCQIATLDFHCLCNNRRCCIVFIFYQIIFVYISALSKSRYIYQPVGAVTGIRDLYLISCIKFRNFIGRFKRLALRSARYPLLTLT